MNNHCRHPERSRGVPCLSTRFIVLILPVQFSYLMRRINALSDQQQHWKSLHRTWECARSPPSHCQLEVSSEISSACVSCVSYLVNSVHTSPWIPRMFTKPPEAMVQESQSLYPGGNICSVVVQNLHSSIASATLPSIFTLSHRKTVIT